MSATCEDIHSMIELGTFRKDLYARISTFQISLSPLRERREDIELLFHYFISIWSYLAFKVRRYTFLFISSVHLQWFLLGLLLFQ